MIGAPMTVKELEAYIDDLDTQLSGEHASLRAIARYAERLQQVRPYGKHVVVRFSTTGDCLSVSIDGVENDKPAALYSNVEQVDDGYDIGKDGAHYRRYMVGQKTWWLLLGDEVAFVSTRKPARTATNGMVVYEWGVAA